VHFVDTGQVPRAREQLVLVADRYVGRLMQRLLPDIQHFRELFWREAYPFLQAVDALLQIGDKILQIVVDDPDRVHRRRQTGTVREHANLLAG